MRLILAAAMIAGLGGTAMADCDGAGANVLNPRYHTDAAGNCVPYPRAYTPTEVRRMREVIAFKLSTPDTMQSCMGTRACSTYDLIPQSMRDTVEAVLRADMAAGISPEELEAKAKEP